MQRHHALIYRSIAVSAVAAGGLGLLLPVLPTTPFLLVALWASARGAPEWHARIRHHHRFKSVLDGWEHERAVPRRAKVVAVAVMLASLAMLWWQAAPTWLLMMMLALFSTIAAFLLTRPAPKDENRETD